jgi:flagellar motor switch protein FliN/FliY
MRALPESHMSDIKNVERGEKASELVPSDTRQGKDIQYAGGADTTQEDAPAPTQEGGGEPATTASDPTNPEQLGESANADAAQAAEENQPRISVTPDAAKAPEPEHPPVPAEKKVPVETRDSNTPEDFDLDLLLDIPLEINVELGRARIKVQELLNLTAGSAVKLIKLEGEPVDILVNETLIARGEVVVQNAKYGIRVTEITSRMDRIRSFSI